MEPQERGLELHIEDMVEFKMYSKGLLLFLRV